MSILLAAFVLLSLLLFGGFALVSFMEGENRAGFVSAGLALAGALFFGLGVLLPGSLGTLGLVAVLGGGMLALGAFFWPLKPPGRLRDTPQNRFDERDTMFARAHLQPGTATYREYYAMRPQNESRDALFRTRPGLLSPRALYADPLKFASADASFALTDTMHAIVEGQPAAGTAPLPANPARTLFIKALARYYGALDVGVTTLRPCHVYSHIGRGSGVYGAPLEVEHKFAIAFTVQMDFDMVGCGPQAPIVMESARQYVQAGCIAVQLAAYIRTLGYPARAHMDGDYRVICPLVARDAGLGEIGRMGLLMTPRLGPRVRLAVVTTDLELIPDADLPDASVVDFCEICGKCAENCPARAIPSEARQELDGAMRWQIDSDACFRYWTTVGTDCGRCMAVCPYSHPDSFFHNLIRWGNHRSALFRRMALRLDDLFYGKKPGNRQPPDWLAI